MLRHGANPFSAVGRSSRPVSWTESGIQAPAPPGEVRSQTQWLRHEVEAWQSRSAEQAAALDAAKKQIAELQQQLDQLKAQLNRDAQETGPVADPRPPGDAAAVLADFYRKYPERPLGVFRPVIPYGP